MGSKKRGKSLQAFCAESGRGELLREWDTEKNSGKTPSDVSMGSHQKVWWLCPKGHSYFSSIASRARGSGCPVCAGQSVIPGKNDLASQYPQLAAQWDRKKNGKLTPEMVAPKANRRVWWHCKKRHSFYSSVTHRVKDQSGCPYCAGRKVLAGFNDLATKEPVIASQWHPTLNGELTPQQVTSGSRRRAWWLCENSHAWSAVICSRTGKQRCGCPVCAGRPLSQCTAILSESPAK